MSRIKGEAFEVSLAKKIGGAAGIIDVVARETGLLGLARLPLLLFNPLGCTIISLENNDPTGKQPPILYTRLFDDPEFVHLNKTIREVFGDEYQTEQDYAEGNVVVEDDNNEYKHIHGDIKGKKNRKWMNPPNYDGLPGFDTFIQVEIVPKNRE